MNSGDAVGDPLAERSERMKNKSSRASERSKLSKRSRKSKAGQSRVLVEEYDANSCKEAFQQQKMRTFIPNCFPMGHACIYLVAGVASFTAGLYLDDVEPPEEVTIDYTNLETDANGVSEFNFTPTSDMQAPVFVYYEVYDFYQNHREYQASYSDLQLSGRGFEGPYYESMAGIGGQIERRCRERLADYDKGDEVHSYPCGDVPKSVFNDTFVILEKGSDDEWSRIDVNDSAELIAWPADLRGKFSNIDPEEIWSRTNKSFQESLDMWILERYPPVECRQVDFSDDARYQPVFVGTRVMANGQGNVTTADCTNFMPKDSSSMPSCNFVDGDNTPFACEGTHEPFYREDWGVESGHLSVWMRIAGLPHFRKVWGRIDQDLKAGETYKGFVHNVFPVDGFTKGKKELILATESPWGSHPGEFAFAYKTIGLVCWVMAIWQLIQARILVNQANALAAEQRAAKLLENEVNP